MGTKSHLAEMGIKRGEWEEEETDVSRLLVVTDDYAWKDIKLSLSGDGYLFASVGGADYVFRTV